MSQILVNKKLLLYKIVNNNVLLFVDYLIVFTLLLQQVYERVILARSFQSL